MASPVSLCRPPFLITEQGQAGENIPFWTLSHSRKISSPPLQLPELRLTLQIFSSAVFGAPEQTRSIHKEANREKWTLAVIIMFHCVFGKEETWFLSIFFLSFFPKSITLYLQSQQNVLYIHVYVYLCVCVCAFEVVFNSKKRLLQSGTKTTRGDRRAALCAGNGNLR